MKPYDSKISTLALSLGLAAFAACGAEDTEIKGRLRVPEARHTRMSLSPALDVSSVLDPALLDRIVIDEIVVNVADVRLLGSEPRVPTGGLRLAASDKQISSLENGIAFPMPGNLRLEDIALFVQLAPSAALDGASVVVRARLFETAQSASIHQLRESTDKDEPDPDGSPANPDPMEEPDPDGSPAKGGPKGEPDPDGSPAKGGPKGEPDPDGSPAMGITCEPDPDGSPAMKPCIKKSLRRGLTADDYVTFELRGSDSADLLVSLASSHPFDVVVGIPAGRWFTPQTVATLEAALDQNPADAEEVKTGAADEKPVVVSSTPRGMQASEQPRDDGESMPNDRGSEDYRLLGGEDADPSSIRKH